MKHITAMNESSPGRQFVRTLLDSFEVEGPHGTHICLVYEPLREPIWLLQRSDVPARPESRKPAQAEPSEAKLCEAVAGLGVACSSGFTSSKP